MNTSESTGGERIRGKMGSPKSLRDWPATETIAEGIDDICLGVSDESGECLARGEAEETPPARKSTSSMPKYKKSTERSASFTEVEQAINKLLRKEAWNFLYMAFENFSEEDSDKVAKAISSASGNRKGHPPLREILDRLSAESEIVKIMLRNLQNLLEADKKDPELEAWGEKPSSPSTNAMEIVRYVEGKAVPEPPSVGLSKSPSKPPSSSSGKGIIRKWGGLKSPDTDSEPFEPELGRSEYQFSSSRRIKAAEISEKLTPLDRLIRLCELIGDEEKILSALALRDLEARISRKDMKKAGFSRKRQEGLEKIAGIVCDNREEVSIKTDSKAILALLKWKKIEIQDLIDLSKEWGILFTAREIEEAKIERKVGKTLVKRLIANHLFRPKELLHKS